MTEPLDTPVGTADGTRGALRNPVHAYLRDAPDMASAPLTPGAQGDDEARRMLNAGAELRSAQGSATPSAGEWKPVTVLCCAPAAIPEGAAFPEREARYRRMHDLYAAARSAVQRYGGILQLVVGERSWPSLACPWPRRIMPNAPC